MFHETAPVSLTATASKGLTFAGWSGACSGVGACALVMNADETLTASFTKTGLQLPDTKLVRAEVSSRAREANFRFAATGEHSGFQCALVRRPTGNHGKSPVPHYSTCRSPKTFRHLAHAGYEFYVRATGNDGAEGPAVRRAFTIR